MKIFNEETPLYLQLRKHIEELILERKLAEDASIPSIRIMARDYNLNPVTVGNALVSLVDEGVLYKKRGVGIFVAPKARELIINNRGADFVQSTLEPALRKARQLDLPKEEIFKLTNAIYGGKDE